MKKTKGFCVFCGCLVLLSIFGHDAWAENEKGPLRVKNHFTPHMMFLTPAPNSPESLDGGDFNLGFSADYSSVFVNDKSRDWEALVDMEMAVLEFNIEVGVFRYLSLAVNAPFINMNKGFMDDFLERFHDAFNFPNYGKEKRPKNEFGYILKKDDKDWIRSHEGGLYIGDVTVSAKIPLIRDSQNPYFSSSFQYSLKTPTGDEDYGFGSGEFDHAFYLLNRISYKSFAFYLNPCAIILSDPKTQGAEISVRNIYGVFGGIEYMINESWSLLAQVNHYTAPLENTGIVQFDVDSTELTVGFIWQSDTIAFELAFCEDLTRAAPDFNVHAMLRFLIDM